MSTSPQPPPVGFSAPGYSAQKYSDDMMIIPVEHYMKDSGMRQDVGDLMSGDMFRSSNARVKLGRKGYSDAFLKKMQDTGWRWKYMQPPNGLQFGLVPADEEIVAMLPPEHIAGQDTAITAAYRGIARSKKTEPSHSFAIPLSSLGLSVVSIGSDIYVRIKDADALKHALRQAQIIRNINGKRAIWRMRMNGGRPVVDPNTLKIAKLSGELKIFKIVRIVGKASVIAGATISFIRAMDRNDSKGWSKFGLDIVMTGVAFIPPFGWVVSGVYFVADATLDVCGIDWWSVFYDEMIAPARNAEDIAMLDALAMALH